MRSPLKLLARAVQETPKIYSLLLLPLVTPTEAEGIFLLLKIPCTTETEPIDPLHCNWPECLFSEY